MIRLALIGRPDDAAPYGRVAPRLRGGRFAAVASGNARAARCIALELGAEVCTDSLEALLTDHTAAFDAIVLLSTLNVHAPFCQRAAKAGKHLLLDDPSSPTWFINVIGDVIAACARTGVRLMVGNPLRFLPSIQAIKASLNSGQLGEPGLLRIHRWKPPEMKADPASNLTGEIDLACWLFGGWPTSVYAVRHWQPEKQLGVAPDYFQLHLGFAGGGMALIDHAQTLPPGDGYFSLSLIGSTGAVYADDHHNMQLLFGRGHPAALQTRQGDLALLAQLQEFIRAIEEGRDPAITGADGQRAMRVAAAAALSIGKVSALSQDGDGYTLVD